MSFETYLQGYKANRIQIPLPSDAPIVKCAMLHHYLFFLTNNGKMIIYSLEGTTLLPSLEFFENKNIISIHESQQFDSAATLVAFSDEAKLYTIQRSNTQADVFKCQQLDVSLPDPIVQVATGDSHVVLLTSNNQVYTWGSNAYSQLGLRDSGFRTDEPEFVASLQSKKIISIEAGNFCSYFVAASGEVYSCGSNSHHQLARVTSTHIGQLQACLSLRGTQIYQVVYGNRCAYGITKDRKTVWSWGDNTSGMLGHGETRGTSTPIAKCIEGLQGKTIKSISSGFAHTLFFTEGGSLYFTGSNQQRQINPDVTGWSFTAPFCLGKYKGEIVHFAQAIASHTIVQIRKPRNWQMDFKPSNQYCDILFK